MPRFSWQCLLKHGNDPAPPNGLTPYEHACAGLDDHTVLRILYFDTPGRESAQIPTK